MPFNFLLSFFLSLAVATPPLHLSTDNGAHWADLSAGLPDDLDLRGVVEKDGTLILLTNARGIYHLPPGANCWARVDGGFSHATTLTLIDDRLVAGSYSGGVFVSDDGGLTWRQPLFNIRHAGVRSLYTHERRLYVGTDKGLHVSYDRGESWFEVAKVPQAVNAITAHGGRLIIARQNGMGILKKDGVLWSEAGTRSAIIQLISEGEYVYAICANEDVWRSRDGRSWVHSEAPTTTQAQGRLGEALWQGFRPHIPGREASGIIHQTSRGWIVGRQSGC